MTVLEAIITIDVSVITGDVSHHVIISHNDDIQFCRSIDQLIILSQLGSTFCIIYSPKLLFMESILHHHLTISLNIGPLPL